MSLNLNVPKVQSQLTPRLAVVGVGGAGGNAVNNMIQSNLEGVEFLVANTDAQALAQSVCDRRIQLGRNVTQGLGAGSRPDIGRAAAEEALDEILGELESCNMVFITAGMGGGTGTGAAPVLARAAREAGILTVGVITKPFQFEGIHRMQIAEAGVTELQQYVDTLIIIPNQNLFRVANEKTTFADAFKMADDVLYSGVRGVTDLIVMPGLINLDFADIQSVMTEMGKAMMGTGEAEGDNRAIEAAEAAISNPLLDDVSMKGARGVLINITGGMDLTLFEVDESANRIRDEVDPDANIIFGSTFDETLEGKMRVSVVATGIDVEEQVAPRPVTLSLVSDKARSLANKAADRAAGASSAATASAPAAPEPEYEQEPASAEYGPQDQADTYETGAEAQPSFQGEAYASRQEAEPAPAESLRMETPPMDSPRGDTGRTEAETWASEDEQDDWRDDSFIAPPAVEPETPPPARFEADHQADPFAEAEIANSARSSGSSESSAAPSFNRKKAYSLFSRVKGAARAIQSGGSSREEPSLSQGGRDQDAERAPEPATQRGPSGFDPVDGSSQAGLQGGGAVNPAEGQPRFSGLDPTEPASGSRAEEDQLDIPAFLRRQAN